VIFRGDDAGSSEGANLGIAQAVRDGVLRNVSVMAPGLAFDHAVEVLRDMDGIDVGLHVTLNAEWDRVKWGPVLPVDQVPSLIDDEGWFTTQPMVLHERGFSVDEAVAEVEAQLARVRASGLLVRYLDEHMGVGWLPGLRDRLASLCDREGLIYAGRFKFLEGVSAQDVSELLGALLDLTESPRVVVTHPGSNVDPVMRDFTLGGLQPGEVLRERAQDRRTLTDARLVDAVERGLIRSLRYSEAVSA